MQIKDYLDRFEILFPENNKLQDYRRAYTDKDLSSIFRLLENEDLRKAVMEENLYSVFRLVKTFNKEETEDFRKAVTEKNLHSIFRLSSNDNLKKLVLDDNISSLWKILSEITPTTFTSSFKHFTLNDISFDSDCFSQGQLKSKLWLVKELKNLDLNLGTVFLCAGWYATLAVMLFENNLTINKIRSFDIDPSCIDIAERFNKHWEMNSWQFKSVTKNILDINYQKETYQIQKPDDSYVTLTDIPDTIINTSCEHIENFSQWYNLIPTGKIVILQTNDYFEIEDHVNCSDSLDQFAQITPMGKCLFSGEIDLGKYRRFMRIGIK
jgi:hypothetical protein